MDMKPGDQMRVKFAILPAAGPKDVAKGAEQIADWLAR